MDDTTVAEELAEGVSTPQGIRSTVRFRLGTALTIVVIGIVASVGWAAWGVRDVIRLPGSFARAALPADVVVRLDPGARRVVYVENASADCVTGLHVTGPDGEAVDTGGYAGGLRYDTAPDGTARAIGSFTAPSTGHYRVAVVGPPIGTRVAVGVDLGGRTIRALAGPAIVALSAVFLALVVALAPTSPAAKRIS